MKIDTTWLVANWKMNGNAERVRAYAFALNAALSAAPKQLRAVFCPPVLYLPTAAATLPQNARLQLGAQDCHAKREGACTGEIAAAMLADSGAACVILGHSERRAMGETDAMVLAKAEAALAAGLTPILCVGESETSYMAKETNAVLKQQLAGFSGLPEGSFLIAYEPIWAIGTGKTPTTIEIAATHCYIKSVLGSETSVLYGGSVNAGNAKEILGIAEVSGALIGGASLDIASMRTIIAAAHG